MDTLRSYTGAGGRADGDGDGDTGLGDGDGVDASDRLTMAVPVVGKGTVVLVRMLLADACGVVVTDKALVGPGETDLDDDVDVGCTELGFLDDDGVAILLAMGDVDEVGVRADDHVSEPETDAEIVTVLVADDKLVQDELKDGVGGASNRAAVKPVETVE